MGPLFKSPLSMQPICWRKTKKNNEQKTENTILLSVCPPYPLQGQKSTPLTYNLSLLGFFWTHVMIWFSAPASTKTPSTNSGTDEKLCWIHCRPSSKLTLCMCQKASPSQTQQWRCYGSRRSVLKAGQRGGFRSRSERLGLSRQTGPRVSMQLATVALGKYQKAEY